MGYPIFDTFSLQDDNFIVEKIEYRNTPNRDLETSKIARRPGVKLLSNEFTERRVRMSGWIIGTDANNLQSLIDNLHKNVTRKDEGTLSLTADRTATATVVSVGIQDPHYAQDAVPFDIEFLLADPFFYGGQHYLLLTVTSGVSSMSTTVTISGSIFATPSIIYSAPAGSGQTTTSGIIIEYKPTGETVTWSGNGSSVGYGGSITFDYENQKILNGTVEAGVGGIFSKWDPQTSEFTTTFSGGVQGGTLAFNYQERYL